MSANSRRRPYGRIPRVRRFEYIQAFLKGIQEEGSLAGATEKIHQAMAKTAGERARAFGKRSPRVTKGHQLTQQCLQLCTRVGLLHRDGGFTIRPAALPIVKDLVDWRHLLFSKLWNSYEVFSRVLAGIHTQGGEIRLPISRSPNVFEAAARSLSLEVDHMSFEITRDLLTEAEVTNWRLEMAKSETVQCVYVIVDSRSHLSNEDVEVPMIPDFHWVGSLRISEKDEPDIDSFEAVLWEEYLNKTNFRPNLPVLYPELRDLACYRLRISDRAYDSFILRLIDDPRRLLVYPAGGIIEYTSAMWLINKNIPPVTRTGEYISYLRVDRRN